MGVSADTTEAVGVVREGLSLRRNVAWTFLGNVVYAGCQWGMLVALAKLGSPEMVGQFALGLAIGAPVMLLTNLQLRTVQATDARNEYRFSDYLALRLTTAALALVVISLIVWLAGFRWQTALVVVLVGIAKSVESISDVIYGLMQKYERLDRIATAMMLRGVGSLIAFALALRLTGRVAPAVVAMTAWWGTVLLVYERRAGESVLREQGIVAVLLRPDWEWEKLRRLAWLAAPLGAVMMLISLNTNIPRYFVERYFGGAALGYFAALAYVAVAQSTLMNALGQSATPRLTRYNISDRSAFLKLLMKMLILAAVIGGTGIFVAVVWGKPLLTLLYRPDYAEHSDVLILLMVAAALANLLSMLGCAMTSQRVFRAQLPLALLMVVSTLVVCSTLIHSQGLGGAAASLIVANFLGMTVAAGYEIRLVRRTSEVRVVG